MKDSLIKISDDTLGQKYSCAICGFSPNRLNVYVKGWGKSQRLRKLVREHIRQEHSNIGRIV